MNALLDRMVFNMMKVKAIMKHLEGLCTEYGEELSGTYFALVDEIENLQRDLDQLIEDNRVVNAINALKKN